MAPTEIKGGRSRFAIAAAVSSRSAKTTRFSRAPWITVSTVLFWLALNLRAAEAASAATSGAGQFAQAFDPALVGGVGAAALTIAAAAWALKVTAAARSASSTWTRRLAEMEARLEKAEGVLTAHPGLVLVWDDEHEAAGDGWGAPKILGGPAALASLMSFAASEPAESAAPVDRLLHNLGDLTLEDDADQGPLKSLRERVADLRAHGIAFSGALTTSDGRVIEADGRVAGGQVALWLTDPAVRMAEDGGIMGRVRENSASLHAALTQLERAPAPAWRRDPALRIVWANAAYAEAAEAESPAVVVRDQIELDAAARRVAERARQDRRAADGRIAVNVGGARRIYHVSETPIHGGGDAALCGYALDVSDLEIARADLARHIDANRRTLDQIPAAVALFGQSQELAYYNAAFQALFRLEAAVLDARPSHGEGLDRLRQAGRLPEQPDYRAWKRSELALYTDAPTPHDAAAPDDVWALPDGRSLRVARMRHPMGGVLIVFEDITERLKLEALYNTQIKVQRATLDNLSEAVATFSANGALNLHNRAFRDLWRFDDETLEARPPIDKVIAALGARAPEESTALALIRKRTTSMSAEDRRPIKDAYLPLADGRTVAYGSQPLPDGATLVHFLDVTDSREREKELQERNALLEDIDRQKSRFVDHVSYQLRTPLNTIIGFAEMIDGQMFGVLNDRQRDYVASILTASYALKDLIADIMDLAAMDAGKLSIDRAPVDIRELLTSAATYAALKAEDTQVSLKVDCPKDIGVMSADGRRLKQVLFNLLSNAFAYTGVGGEVRLGAERAPGLISIWVEDSGRGVSPEDQARAFDAFESSGPSAGAGLGLALVQRFVNLHGGWVRLESTPGAGTRVACFLPASEHGEAEGAPPPRKAVTAAPVDGGGGPEQTGGGDVGRSGAQAAAGAKAANSATEAAPNRRRQRGERRSAASGAPGIAAKAAE